MTNQNKQATLCSSENMKMPEIPVLVSKLRCTRLTARFFSESPVQMKHWIGSAVRNNFMKVAAETHITGNLTLRDLINTLPLDDRSHFLYKQLHGGFPKGFVPDISDIATKTSSFMLEGKRVYSFSLNIFGRLTEYASAFKEAIGNMLEEGFGHPVRKMTVIDIKENELPSLWTHETDVAPNGYTMSLSLDTPLSLPEDYTTSETGYQDKLNCTPTLYQLVRTSLFRLITLYLLYEDNSVFTDPKSLDEYINRYASAASTAVLECATLSRVNIHCTPKKESENRIITLHGYSGKLIYSKIAPELIPLLIAGTVISSGAYTNYGLGRYSAEMTRKTNLLIEPARNTPSLHFQSKQPGVTLKASELNP